MNLGVRGINFRIGDCVAVFLNDLLNSNTHADLISRYVVYKSVGERTVHRLTCCSVGDLDKRAGLRPTQRVVCLGVKSAYNPYHTAGYPSPNESHQQTECWVRARQLSRAVRYQMPAGSISCEPPAQCCAGVDARRTHARTRTVRNEDEARWYFTHDEFEVKSEQVSKRHGESPRVWLWDEFDESHSKGSERGWRGGQLARVIGARLGSRVTESNPARCSQGRPNGLTSPRAHCLRRTISKPRPTTEAGKVPPVASERPIESARNLTTSVVWRMSSRRVDSVYLDEAVLALGAVPLHLRSEVQTRTRSLVELVALTVRALTFQREAHASQ